MAPAPTKSIFLAVLVLLTSCSEPPLADLRGVWGGTHIGLTITNEGSSLEFDCAAGTIPGAFEVDSQGYFNLTGTYTPGNGGPEPFPNEPTPPLPTAYFGRISGHNMRLTVDPEGDIPSTTYELQKGREPGIFRCL